MTTETKQLTETVYVAGQVLLEQIAEFKKAGFKSIINNRPDGEGPGQPHSSELQVAVESAGLAYQFLPMSGQLSLEMLQDAKAGFQQLPTPVLAFCTSGTRSTILWCCAHVEERGVDAVLQTAADAGYQLQQIRPLLEQITGFAE